MTIIIEKYIPLPGRALKSSFPFEQMEVGDSFFVDTQKTVATKSAERRLGFQFKAKQVNGGCRVWRTG